MLIAHEFELDVEVQQLTENERLGKCAGRLGISLRHE
jgi:cell division protein FtsL